MIRAAALFPAFLLLAVAGLLATGYLVYEYSPAVLGFPLGVGALLCLLCALEIGRTLTGRAAASSQGEQLSIAALAWMFALAAFVLVLGFVFGPALYLLACLRANGFGWRLAIAVAAASIAVTWGVFIEIFGILLPVAPPWLS